jgi:hypothetical protein
MKNFILTRRKKLMTMGGGMLPDNEHRNFTLRNKAIIMSSVQLSVLWHYFHPVNGEGGASPKLRTYRTSMVPTAGFYVRWSCGKCDMNTPKQSRSEQAGSVLKLRSASTATERNTTLYFVTIHRVQIAGDILSGFCSIISYYVILYFSFKTKWL